MLYKIISILLLLHTIGTESFPYGLPLDLDETNSTLLINGTRKDLDYRLPDSVVPENYKIVLTPYFDENSDKSFTFDGAVNITLHIKKKVPAILIHSEKLNFTIKDVRLRKNGSNKLTGITLKSDPERSFKHIKPKTQTNFKEGKYVLSIKYKGTLNSVQTGFHRSSYINGQGERRWLAATQFESTGARLAFPSFDEPKFKATFDITMRHSPDHYAISNMPIKTSTLVGSTKETTFETTPLMSTYLVAFVVSDFKYISKNKNFTVHARPNAIQNGKVALETGEKLLKALEDFTDIKFEISKMDQIAIPGKGGAMENWGLVTYGEGSLLFDEKASSTAEKQNIVETIAHEFAHQWFGDLVTPKWWKFLWLKEGFASFFQNYITEQVEPEWQSVYQSVVKSIQTTTFDFDSRAQTHPINQDVESPTEIRSIYDSISYQKGGAIIRMMQHFLGHDIFKRGLNIYLTENQFNATVSDDLFQAFDKAASENKVNFTQKLQTIMDSWVNCKGYPIVTVSRKYDSSGELEMEQKRFTSYDATEEETKACRWYIPINYAHTSNQDFDNTSSTFWLKEPSKTLHTTVKPNEWIILNKQQTGLYRVNYDEKNWQLIINHLNSDKHHQIHVLNKAQLMNDAFAFVKQGSLKLETLLRLTSYLTRETDYFAWYPAFKTYSWLETKLTSTEYYPFFKEYVVNTTRKFVESVGLEESAKDSHIDKFKRMQAIRWACSHGNTVCTDHMKNKLEKWLNEPEKNLISPDYKQLTLCQGLRTSTFDLWKKVFNRVSSSNNTQEKNYLMSALACSHDKKILQYFLNYTVQENSLLNDTVQVAGYIQTNSDVGVDTVLDFAIKRFITLVLKYKNVNVLSSLFTNIGQRITAKTQLEKLKATKDMDIPEKVTSQGIKAAEKNLEWLEQNEEAVMTWIKEVKAKNEIY